MLRSKHGLADEWASDLHGPIVLTNAIHPVNPIDGMLPVVRVGFEKHRYEAVISPSVDMDDPKVIANIKHIQQKPRKFMTWEHAPSQSRT